MPVSDEKVFWFQSYTLDLRRGHLCHADQSVELRPKSFALLRYLVENAGRLVSKDELIDAVWGNVAVTDVSLARCVSDVRLALRDHSQKIIRTVPRRGYLFAETVTEAAAPAITPSETQLSRYPGESRQLTIMSCELVGLSHSGRVDQDDLRDAMAFCHRQCRQIIELHHGYVSRNSGDGLLAFFGYPEASEQDAENAMRAALALRDLAVTLSASLGTDLKACIGVASGVVAIADEPSVDTRRERTVIGEALILSGRLQALAESGQILIAENTRCLVRGLFDYRDLDRMAIKGLATPVRISQVVGETGVESRFEAKRLGRLTQLVGREEILGLLLRRWQQAQCGEGSVVLLVGEPGIGKSRVAQTIGQLLSDEPHTKLSLFCSPHHQESALSPFIRMIKRAASLQDADTDQQRLIKLEALVGQATKASDDAVPLVADLLSIPTGDRYPQLPHTPEKRKEETLAVLLKYVEGLAASKPLLLLIEDVHWADPTSLELIDLIVELAPHQPILVIATFRPELICPWADRLQTTLITLGRLSLPQSAKIVADVSHGRHLPIEIVDEVLQRADGIPLFVEELTKAVIESDDLEEACGYSTKSPGSALKIPATLRGSLLARLDRLKSAREVAQIGAALGRRFSHKLISAVVAMPQQQLDHALGRLVNAELIWRRGIPPDAEYTFKHALVQDAAYGTLLRDSRRALHKLIAETLESRFSSVVENQPELLAHHYTEAGLIEKSSRLWGKAGQISLTRSALKEAATQLTRALTQIEMLPGTATLRREQIKLQIALATALMHTKGYAAPETRAALDCARLLVERAQDLGEPPEDPLLLFSVLHGFWVANHVAFNGEVILDLAVKFMALAEKQGTPFTLLLGHRVMGTSLLFLGDFAEARSHLDRAMLLYDPAEHRSLGARFGQEAGVAILSNRPLALWLLGYPEAALKEANEALSYARDLGQVASFLYAVTRVAWFHLVVRDYSKAAEQIQELMDLAQDMEGSYWTAAGRMLQGCLFALTSKGSAAISHITSGIAISRLQGANLLRMPWYLSCMATAYIELGQLDEAGRCITDAIAAMETTKETWQESEIYRMAGELALISPTPDRTKAEIHFGRALAIARQQQAKSWELRAAASMARLWMDQGKRNEARDLLGAVYGWFTDGFESHDLKDARALLDKLA
jgi:DNA-binding winged helix-turn-helix (wHTH) protein/predicted ATPase